mmetsp:Transcript_5456/g.5592  ORF Transcript_5456/g.5592 Transcript_5456/m.5592 type:complete len:393 (-) Transcript_5456:115-1293(-)
MNSRSIKSLQKSVSISKLLKQSFSTSTKSQGESISQKFHNIYIEEMQRLQASAQNVVKANYKVKDQNQPEEAYKHPYHSEQFPVFFSTQNLFAHAAEAIGTEPVSPHYESFVMSRRIPILGGLFMVLAKYFEDLNINSFYGRQSIYEIYTILILAVGFNESRYIFQRFPMPRLTWYYDAFQEHEFRQICLNWFDSIEDQTRRAMHKNQEQIDYYLIHKEYNFVKKRVLAQYLENQRLSLTNHFNERTISLLSNIANLENNNIKSEVSRIAQESLDTVLDTIKDSSKNKEILDNSFESALDGLRLGVMEYKNDKVLPLYLNEIESRSAELKNLSAKEENQRFALTGDQRKYLIDLDRAAKNQYLSKEPEVGSAIKNLESYKGIVDRIKSKIQG